MKGLEANISTIIRVFRPPRHRLVNLKSSVARSKARAAVDEVTVVDSGPSQMPMPLRTSYFVFKAADLHR